MGVLNGFQVFRCVIQRLSQDPFQSPKVLSRATPKRQTVL